MESISRGFWNEKKKRVEKRKSDFFALLSAVCFALRISARKTRALAHVAAGMNNGFARSHAGYARLNIHNASLRHPCVRTTRESVCVRVRNRVRFVGHAATRVARVRALRARARSLTGAESKRTAHTSRGTLKFNQLSVLLRIQRR